MTDTQVIIFALVAAFATFVVVAYHYDKTRRKP